MAVFNLKKGESLTLTDSSVNEIVLSQSLFELGKSVTKADDVTDVIFKTGASNSGTIKFAVYDKGTSPNLAAHSAVASDKNVFLTVNANQSVFVQASGTGQELTAQY